MKGLLRNIYQDYNSSFKELLSKDSSLTKCFNQMAKAKKKSFCILKDLIDKSSLRKCSVRKDALRNCAKFRGKHLYQSLFFNKVADFSLQRH